MKFLKKLTLASSGIWHSWSDSVTACFADSVHELAFCEDSVPGELPTSGGYRWCEAECKGEDWGHHVAALRRFADRVVVNATQLKFFDQWFSWASNLSPGVGMRIRAEQHMPLHTFAQWAAKLCMALGEGSYVCIEGPIAVFRLVQDVLSRHPLSLRAAPIIPVIRPVLTTIGDTSVELIDLEEMDALYLELRRPFCDGCIIVRGKRLAEPWLPGSFFAFLSQMVEREESSRSVLGALVLDGVPATLRAPLLQALFATVIARQETKAGLKEHKAILEEVWGKVIRSTMPAGGGRLENARLATLISTLLQERDAPVPATSLLQPKLARYTPSRSCC